MNIRIAHCAFAVSAALASVSAFAQLTPPSAGALDIWFKAPLAGATVSGSLSNDKCYIRGAGVMRVDFFLDSTPIGSDSAMADGMSCVLDTTKFANGAHQVKAVARDAGGKTYTEVVAINIQNAASTTPVSTTTTTATTTPTGTLNPPGSGALNIWWKAPAAGQTVKGTLSLANCYINGTGVTKVDFFLDSTPLNSDTAMADGMSCVLDTTKFANGTHQLKAVARNSAGATYNEVRSVNVQNAAAATTPTATTTSPATTTPASTTASPISNLDILELAQADVPFAQQQAYWAEAFGTDLNTQGKLNPLTENGIHGSKLPNGETLRLGKVTAADGKPALSFTLAPGDPLQNSSHRSELEFLPVASVGAGNIEHEKTYWYAYKVFIYDWGTLAAGDESFFGAHIHSGDMNIGIGGPHGLVTYAKDNGGRSFRVWTAWTTPSAPRSAQTWMSSPIPIPFGRWVDFVGKIRQSQTNGLLQVWMDGVQIANRSGPVGLYTPGFKDYFKAGFYNWSGTQKVKTVMLRSVVVVNDPTGGKYNPEDLRAFIQAH
jgi:hypothetical protein